MSGILTVPAGFAVVARGDATLVADSARLPDLERLGLDRPAGWNESFRGTDRGAGRGSIARLELGRGHTIVLKRLRRGGLAGPLWRGCFAGTRRPLENLEVALEARRRGVATPAPVALMIQRRAARMVRAWLAVEEVAGAVDLASRFDSDRAPDRTEIGEVMKTVRAMHDRGIEHRDLNLGNLLVRGDEGSIPGAFVIDLDAARVHSGALSFRLRQRALRRLERSSCKLGVGGAGGEEVRAMYYELYAGEDLDLARRLDRGRAFGRFVIAIHALRRRRAG